MRFFDEKVTHSMTRTLEFLGRKYVPCINYIYWRSGVLWEGHHKGSVIESKTYSLTCSRCIEMDPVRIGMVDASGAYPWSSYARNALGRGIDWLAPTPEYRALGADDDQRG